MITIEQLNEALADRLEDLLPDLIGGQERKGEWYALSTRDGGVGDSLSVHTRGAKRGRWYHHAAGVGGDPLGLINYVRFNNADMKRAFAWARDFLGARIAPETEKDRELRRQRLQAADRKLRREERERKGRARYYWHQLAQRDIAGTPAWHYLNNRLDGRFARLGHVPGCIRFMPELLVSQLSTRDRQVKLPAMVTGIVDASGEQIALHRTWLVKRGAGDDSWDRLRAGDVATYADCTSDGRELKGKKVLGSFKGGTIRLWPGNRVDTKTGEVKRGVGWPHLGPNSAIMLAEGIETALSLALAFPERRIVSTVSVEGFADVVLPPCFQRVTIAADRDDGNAAVARALDRAKEMHAAAGRNLTIVYPPEGIDDWNTALKAAGRAT